MVIKNYHRPAHHHQFHCRNLAYPLIDVFILLAILVVNCIAIKVDRKDCIDRFKGETSHQDILSSNGEENDK